MSATGPLADIDYQVLAGFQGGAVIAVWSTVMISGFFPRAAGPAVGRGPVGSVLVFLSALAMFVLVAVLVIAAPRLPWAVSTIAVGLAVLGAPFLAQPLPGWFRNSRSGLLAVLASCAAASYMLASFIQI